MILNVFLEGITLTELGLCLFLAFRLSKTELNTPTLSRKIIIIFCMVFYALYIFTHKKENYFHYKEWIIEDLFLVLLGIVLTKIRRVTISLISIFLKHILIFLDYYVIFTLHNYKPKYYTIQSLLENGMAEVIFIYFLLRLIVLLLVLGYEIKGLIIDSRKNNGLLLMLVGLSCVMLYFQQAYFLKGMGSMAAGYRYILYSVLVGCLVFGGVYELIRNNLERERFIAMQNEVLEKNFNQLYAEQRQLERTVHDFKNHVVLLTQYLKDGKYEEALNYCQKIGTPLKVITQKSWSGNRMLDTILNTKFEEAEQRGIKIDKDISSISKVPMTDYDTCVVVSNLLDNAIEANEFVDEERRNISVIVQMVNHVFLIKILNPIGSRTIKKGEHYQTTKKDKMRHGLGLESVRSSLENYQGEVILKEDGDLFSAVVSIVVSEKL